MFKIGEVPTGDKDPFALRRHALGIIRILIEKDLSLELDKLVQRVIGITEDADIPEKWESRSPDFMLEQYHTLYQIRQELLIFFYERLAGSLRDQGYTAQEVDAVLSLNPQQLSDIPKRLAAVRAFAALPEAASLAAANKRVGNILKKTEGSISDTVDTGLLQEPAEQALYQALTGFSSKTKEAFDSGDYTASLQILAALKSPVDTFFDHVMVNVEDESLRKNRLALLKQLHQIMNQIADLSKLAS